MLAAGIDIKADGGYVVTAPSLHPSGTRYRWHGEFGPKALLHPANPPAWLSKLLTSSAHAEPRVEINTEQWMQGSRNNRLASIAGRLLKCGLCKEAIEDALLKENELRCSPPVSPVEVRRVVASIIRYEPVQVIANGWGEPLPLGAKLPAVEGFKEELLPVSLRFQVTDIARRMQVPTDYPAAATITCLAGAVSRRVSIQPKVNDTGWQVVPNLWGGIVGRPGFKKSPVIKAVTFGLRQIQGQWFDAHKEDEKERKRECELQALRINAWKQQVTQAMKKGDMDIERPPDPADVPACKRLLVTDCSFAALHRIMSENPAGLLVLRDELTGWLAQLDKPGREDDRTFCLEAWAGDSSFTIDRIERGTIHVPHACMSVLGGIQPARLQRYLSDALRSGPSDDGLIQRFQVLTYPDLPDDWEIVDREPDEKASQAAVLMYERLLELQAEQSALFKFEHDAQRLFFDWYSELEMKVRKGDLHDALASHLSKYSSLMPSLALLFELADQACAGRWSSDRVSLEHTRQAVAVCGYLESHARRIYSSITSPQMRAAIDLADRIEAGKLGAEGSLHLRDIYRAEWSGLDTPERAREAVLVLEEFGWVKEISAPASGPQGGRRAASSYLLNPRLQFEKGAARSSRTLGVMSDC